MSTHVLIKAEIDNYKTWRPIFNVHQKEAVKNGMKYVHVLLDNDNPKLVTVLFETPNPVAAKKFLQSQRIKDLMKESGVISKPEIIYLSDSRKRK